MFEAWYLARNVHISPQARTTWFSSNYIVLDDQNRFALLLNIPKGVFVTGYYKGEQFISIPFFVELSDSLHAVVTFAEVAEANAEAKVETDSLHSAAKERRRSDEKVA